MTQPLVYDIGIIGGGIAGAAIAREARLRGLTVILFEKNTFGSGTSSKSSKLIHGGLRYLETAWSALITFHVLEFWKNLRFVFLALRESHALARQWPGLIKEIELLMPVYKNQGRNRYAVFFGTWLYGLLSQLSGGKKGTRILKSAEQVLKLEPGLNRNGLLGGAIVQDYTTDDLALVKQIIQDASARGAQTFEQAEVTHYHFDSGQKIFEIETVIKGNSQTFYTKRLINASGAWADLVRTRAGGEKSDMLVPVAGAHAEMPVFTNYSVILQAEDQRIFFVINRAGRARIGTTERLEKNPERVEATHEEIRYLLSAVKNFFPAANLLQSEIISTDAGIRPLAKPRRPLPLQKISREHQFVFDPDGSVHVLGVKLTDHRRAANELLGKLFKRR